MIMMVKIGDTGAEDNNADDDFQRQGQWQRGMASTPSREKTL